MYMYHQSIQSVLEVYRSRGAELQFEMTIEFESDWITVDIPLEGISVEGGWRIRPLAYPMVRH